jgi:ribose transport system permease protein
VASQTQPGDSAGSTSSDFKDAPQRPTMHAKGAPASRSWLHRLATAQESGLVLVILAMGLLLALAGGSKPQPQVVEVSPGAIVTESGGEITLTDGGVVRRFDTSERWSVRELGRKRVMQSAAGEIVAMGECDQLIEEKGEDGKVVAWLRTTDAGDARRFVAAEGWSVAFVPDRRVIQREYVRFVPVAAGAAVQTQTREVRGSTRDVSYTVDGATYATASGWELATEGGARELRQRAMVNRFLDLSNLVLLAKDASFIAVMAVGMTAIIILGGIDLSVGSIYAFAALLGALVLRAMQASALGVEADNSVATVCGVPWYLAVPVALLVCCSVGAACGAISGTMVVGLRVHPFIITLGMMAVLRGVVFISTQGQPVLGIPNSFVQGFFKAPIMGVNPVPVFIMVLVAIAGFVVLTRTVLGRRIYAIGGNETAAKYAGIPVGRVKIVVFTLSGLLVGLSACMSLGYFGSASPEAGKGYELDVIAAAVIGGASLSGGRGTALGAVLGAILIQMIRNAMLILDIDTNYTEIVMGAAIVAAVVLDQTKTRLTARKA